MTIDREERWEGSQVLAWILFRDPHFFKMIRENFERTSGDAAEELLKIIRTCSDDIVEKYRDCPFPQEMALDELLMALRQGAVECSYSLDATPLTTDLVSRLDISLHAKYGLYAHSPHFDGPCGTEATDEKTSLRFKRGDILKRWPPINEGPLIKKATIASERRCREWLLSEVKKGPKMKTKNEYRNEAFRLFGVSKRGFDRAWTEATRNNPEWTKAGRPRA